MAMSRVLWVIGLSMTALLAGCLRPRQGPEPTLQELHRYPPTLSAPIFVSREWCDMDGDGTVSEADATLVRENPAAVRDKLDRLVKLVNELAEVPYEPDWDDLEDTSGGFCPTLVGLGLVKVVLDHKNAEGVLLHGCTFVPPRIRVAGCVSSHDAVTSQEMYRDCVSGAAVFERTAPAHWQWRSEHPRGVKLMAAVVLNGAG